MLKWVRGDENDIRGENTQLAQGAGHPQKAKKPPSGGIFYYQNLAAKTPAFRHGDTAALKEYWILTIDTTPALAGESVKRFPE